MTTHWVYRGDPDFGDSPLLLVLQGAVGFVVFFMFFLAMFNGRTGLMLGTGAFGVVWNAAVCGLVARRHPRSGMKAALAFSATALAFAAYSVLDLVGRGDTLPFLQWLGAALVAIGAGAIGVALGRRKRAGSATQG